MSSAKNPNIFLEACSPKEYIEIFDRANARELLSSALRKLLYIKGESYDKTSIV